MPLRQLVGVLVLSCFLLLYASSIVQVFKTVYGCPPQLWHRRWSSVLLPGCAPVFRCVRCALPAVGYDV